MIRHILISIILSLIFVLQITAQTTTISGEVKNPDFYSVSFLWENDLVSGVVKENVIALNGANEFTSDLDIDKPKIVEVRYGSKTKQLFIEPGDNLNINFDARQFEYTFSFSGKGSSNNKVLDFYEKEFGKYTDNFFIYEMAHKSHSDYRSYMDNVHKEMFLFFQKNSITGISYHFRNYLKSEIDYKWAYNLLRYRFENPKANLKPGPVVLPKSYYTFLDKVPVQNPNGLNNKNYHKFIDEYLSYRKDHGSEALKKYNVRVESNSLTLRDEPKTGAKIGTVTNGEILEYLKDRSSVTSQVYTRGKKITTPWIKVRTASGQIGWIIEGGIDFVKSADDSDLGKISRAGKYNDAGKHLKGEVLEFYVAKELHKSVRNGSLPYTQADFDAFLNTSKNPQFKACIEEDFSRKFGSTPSTATSVASNSSSSTTQRPRTSTPVNSNPMLKRALPRSTTYAMGIPKSTELKGVVENPTSKSIDVVFYKNRFSFEEESLTLNLNSRNEFDLVFDIARPTMAKLIYDGKEAEIFIEPGDHLKINFKGNSFLNSLTFDGDCGPQNNFLHQLNMEFVNYDDNEVYNKIVNQQPSNYRFLMDKIRRKKWNFYHQYDFSEKQKFSRGFSKYITAEIEYWWAYNLLRYHWEHPAANGLPYPMKIDAVYYNFLGKVLISNDDAIASKSYLSFLDLYLKLRRDSPDGNIIHQIRQGAFKSIVNNEEVMSAPGGTTPITNLFSGETVKYLNVKSPTTTRKMVNGVMKTDYWYQVGTNDGFIGWVFGGAGTLNGVEDKNVSINQRFKTVEEEKEITRTVATVKVDRLRIRKEPDLPSALGLANEGEELVYLGRKSVQRYTFTLRGLSYNDHFYKIEAPDGRIGWVFGGGIELEEKKSIQKVYKTVPVEQPTAQTDSNSDMYLTGRALFYSKASDIFWKCQSSEPSEIEQDVKRFINSNPYKEYDVAIQEAFNAALRRDINQEKEDPTEMLAAKQKEEEAKRLAAEAEAKKKAEEEAEALAAKIKAEEEAQKLADIKAQKEKAAEEARLAAEAEVKKKAEEEAARIAEEEKRKEEEAQKLAEIKAAKEKAEEEARLAAETEAKKKAEQEAKRLAKEEAKAKRAAEIAANKEAKRIERQKAQEKKEANAKAVAAAKEAKRLEKEEEQQRKAAEEAARYAAAQEAAIKRRKEKEAAALQKKEAKEARIAAQKEERARIAKEKADREAAEEAARLLAQQQKDAEAQKKKEEEEAKKAAEAAALAGTSTPSSEPDTTPKPIETSTNLTATEMPSTVSPSKAVSAPKKNPFQLDDIEECVLDGIALGLTTADAEKQCKEFFEKGFESTKEIGVIDVAEVKTREVRGTLTAAQLLEMIDMTAIEQPKMEVQFSGRITNHRTKLAKVILYPDPVSMREVTYNLYVKPDGTFSTKLIITGPTIGKMEYGARIVELFIEPGNNINVEFSASDFLNSLRFNGTGGEHNNFLKELRTKFTNQDKEATGKVYSERNPRAFKNFLKKIHKDKVDFYNTRMPNFSFDFSQYAKASIDYWYAYNLTNYRWEHPLNFNMLSPMTIRDKSYYDFTEDIQVNNSLALPNEYFAQYVDVFLDDKSKEPENLGLTKLELADKYLEGEVQYFYKAQRLASSCRNGQLSDVIFDVKMFMDYCPYQEYKESIKSELRASKTLLPGMSAPDFTLVDVNGKEVSLGDFKGKAVYLDFWATWCTPCTRQISNTTEMRRKFKGQDVVFVYISTDYTENEWRSYVKRHKITGVHLYAKGSLGSGVATDYGVKQLPSAFIIDKEGKIFKNNSMKNPSNYSLTETLRKLSLSN